MDFKKMVEIDPANLEAGWLGQASSFMEVAETEADASKTVAEIKEEIGFAEAQTAERLRSEAASADKKLTEKALSDMLSLDPALRVTRQKLIKAVYNYDVVVGARRAMDNRKAALENLVTLQMRFGHAEPSVAGTPRAEVRGAMERQRMSAHPVKTPVKKGSAKSDF